MTIAIVISSRFLSFRMYMRNLSFVFAFTHLTTRSLTGVYAEFNEVFEMTDFGNAMTEKKVVPS